MPAESAPPQLKQSSLPAIFEQHRKYDEDSKDEFSCSVIHYYGQDKSEIKADKMQSIIGMLMINRKSVNCR